MRERIINIYCEQIPEHYVGEPSVTISCKPSQKRSFEHDIAKLLLDMAGASRFDYKVKDCRKEKS